MSLISNGNSGFINTDHIVAIKPVAVGPKRPPQTLVQLSNGTEQRIPGSIRDLHLIITGRDMP